MFFFFRAAPPRKMGETSGEIEVTVVVDAAPRMRAVPCRCRMPGRYAGSQEGLEGAAMWGDTSVGEADWMKRRGTGGGSEAK